MHIMASSEYGFEGPGEALNLGLIIEIDVLRKLAHGLQSSLGKAYGIIPKGESIHAAQCR